MLYAEHGATPAELSALPQWHPDRKEFDRLRERKGDFRRGHRPPDTRYGRYSLDHDLRLGKQITIEDFRAWLIREGAEIMDPVRVDAISWRVHPHDRKKLLECQGARGINASGSAFMAIEAFLAGASLPGRIPPIRTLQKIRLPMLCCDASVMKRNAAWGAALIRPGDDLAQDAGGQFRDKQPCTLSAEAQAVANGLWHFADAGMIERGSEIAIYCDNDQVIQMLKIRTDRRQHSRAWRKAKEPVRRAMAAIDAIIAKHDLRPKWRKVNGHVRIENASAPERLNGLADHAARRANNAKCKGMTRP